MDANATRLVRLDWSDGSRTVVSEDPQYDVADVWRDPQTREPQAVVLDESRTRIVVLDPALEDDVERLHDLGDGELEVGRQDRADRRWLVSVAPSDGPIRFHVYDRDAGEATYLFAHKDALDDYELAPMEPFSFVARDGLTVHGYLTFPRGVERQGLARCAQRARRSVGARPVGLQRRGAVAGQPRLRVRPGQLPRVHGLRQGVPQGRRQAVGPGHARRPRRRGEPRRTAGLGRPRAGRHQRRLVRRLRGAGRRRLHP